jgi:hypothetical protein
VKPIAPNADGTITLEDDDVRGVTTAILCGLGLLQAAPLLAQTEQQLRQAFEGHYVIVRMDMPATHKGVDLFPDREPAVDFPSYSSRIREFGVALREGSRVMVTAVRLKKRNIEFQLAGGGYGVFGDDSGSVYVPTVSKSQREKDLEKWIKDESDPERRRRMQHELDDLRRRREREERDRELEKQDLEARKKSEIAVKRLDAGSRVNIWFPDDRLASGGPTPAELRNLLAPAIDFGGNEGPRPEPRTTAATAADLHRGMSLEDVHDLFGPPTRSKSGKQGDLATLTEWYEAGDRVTEVFYVSGVVVRFSTSSK